MELQKFNKKTLKISRDVYKEIVNYSQYNNVLSLVNTNFQGVFGFSLSTPTESEKFSYVFYINQISRVLLPLDLVLDQNLCLVRNPHVLYRYRLSPPSHLLEYVEVELHDFIL